MKENNSDQAAKCLPFDKKARLGLIDAPQSGSRSGAVWGRVACPSEPTPFSPPSYIQRRRPGSRHLSSRFWWRTAPLSTSSPPALPAAKCLFRSLSCPIYVATTFNWYLFNLPCQSCPSPEGLRSWSHSVGPGPCCPRAGWSAGGLTAWSLSSRGPSWLSVPLNKTYIQDFNLTTVAYTGFKA